MAIWTLPRIPTLNQYSEYEDDKESDEEAIGGGTAEAMKAPPFSLANLSQSQA